MTTVAGGMESDSESDCDIVFSTKVSNSNSKKNYHSTPKYSENRNLPSNISKERSFRDENDIKTSSPAMVRYLLMLFKS